MAAKNIYYVLIDWVGGPDGKIFGPRSWCTDRAQRGPCAMTEGQIFYRPARPNSVNKHFIIWPPRFSPFFFPGNKIRNFHWRRSFWPKSRDLYSNCNKVVLVRTSRALSLQNYWENPRMRAVRDPSRAGRVFPALLAPSRTALIRGFSQ